MKKIIFFIALILTLGILYTTKSAAAISAPGATTCYFNEDIKQCDTGGNSVCYGVHNCEDEPY